MKNRMKSVESKAMLKGKSHKSNQQIFMNIRTIFWPYYFFGSSITLNIIKRLREPFEREVEEFKYRSPAVVHS